MTSVLIDAKRPAWRQGVLCYRAMTISATGLAYWIGTSTRACGSVFELRARVHSILERSKAQGADVQVPVILRRHGRCRQAAHGLAHAVDRHLRDDHLVAALAHHATLIDHLRDG